MRSPRHCIAALLTLVFAVALAPDRAAAQDEAVAAYYRGVADHFGLPATEIRLLAESGVQPEEVAVALFLAREAGVSADALVALRKGGRAWNELARRYDVGPDRFHVPVQGSVSTGPLTSAYEAFRGTPTSEWDAIRLDDAAVVHLVNLRVLSEYLGAPPDQVLRAREREGSFIRAYGALLRGVG
jgi:hypothetical protein